MNTRQLFFLVISFALMAGCATNDRGAGTAGQATEVDVRVVEGSAEAAAGEDDIVCTRRHQVGSNFPRTVCTTRAEREEERRRAENASNQERGLRGARRMDPAKMGGG